MYHAKSQSSIYYLYYAQQNDEGTLHTAQHVRCKKKCRKEKKKKESNRNFVKSPNEGGNKELIAVPRLGNPVKRSGPWFSI